MHVVRISRLFLDFALWRTASYAPAGQALMEALDSPDEDTRTLAYMFMVKAGPKSIGLLKEALAQRAHLPAVLGIMGDIADPATEEDIQKFTDDPEPEVADAAREALEVMHYAQQKQA